MAYVLWDASLDDTITPDSIRTWQLAADSASVLLVVGLAKSQWTLWEPSLGLEGTEVYPSSKGTVAVRCLSTKGRELVELSAEEHRALLLTLQEALIKIAETDSDLASKLAARAYVHLKADPVGQRRYDGLLHRFTGGLHRGTRSVD